ncbi:MAG: hypothetical protein ACRCSM_13785 [Sediminibacterium sp.]|jgi:ABC-2 type transport system permease protein
MINRFFIKMALLPTAFYRKIGVNSLQLKAILSAKLVMDDRRPASIQYARKKKTDKPVSGASWGTIIASAFLGLLFLFAFLVTDNSLTQFTIYFSFYIFILAATLITDFTSVLIDIRDNYIILPKPVNDKTVLLSRLLHIAIHCTKVILPLTLSGLIMVGVKYGLLATLVLFFLFLPATLFTIFLINSIYVLVLKLTTPEKFKNLISSFQIFFSVGIYAAYQVIPRLMGNAFFEKYTIPKNIYSLLIPSCWFAGAWKFLTSPSGDWYFISAFILSIVMPILSILIVIKYFAPSFNRKLALISGSEQAPVVKQSKKTYIPHAWVYGLAAWVTKTSVEKAGFLQTWFMTGRSRDFKMKIYPGFGYLAVLIFLTIFRSKKDRFTNIDLKNTGSILLILSLIYFVSFAIMQVLAQLSFSDKYKASWIYYTTPVRMPGELISGSVKAAICKFYLPIAIIITLAGLVFVGPGIIPNLLLGISNQLLVSFTIAYIGYREFPFSQMETGKRKGGTFIKGLISLFIPFLLAFLHYMIFKFTVPVFILLALSIIANWLVAGSIAQRGWKYFNGKYRED